MGELFIHLEIPIPTEPLIGASALTFARWLPIGDSQAIDVERDSIALKLWFDITSTWWASQHKEEDLPRMINVPANRVFADAVVHNVPEIPSLTKLLAILKRKHGVKTLNEWIALDWEIRFQHLRELSFSNLRDASRFFEDIYGVGCFDSAWGTETHGCLVSQYREYQTLRNGILHRGGELSSGAKIEASEHDIEATFEDSRRFRDAILSLLNWCCSWWLNRD